MFVVVTISDSFGYKDELCFDDVESAAEYAHPFVISGGFLSGFDVLFHFGGQIWRANMKTEVTTQKVVMVGMTLEEWSDALVEPEALLIKIQNATLAVIETHDNGKDHRAIKPRRPKARKAAGHRATRKIEKTGSFFECPECPKRFRKHAWLTKHIERHHAASPAAG